MKRLKVRTVEQQIKEGKIECITDIKLGYVEIRRCATGVRETIKVIRNKYQKKVVSEVKNAYLYKKKAMTKTQEIAKKLEACFVSARSAKATLRQIAVGRRDDGMGVVTCKVAVIIANNIVLLQDAEEVDCYATRKDVEFILY